jgi:hypothetical protein
MFDTVAELTPRFDVPTLADALLNPDSTVDVLASMRPGPDAMTPLSVIEPAALSDAGQIDALIAIDRQIGWLQARQQRLIAALAQRAAEADARHPDPGGSHDPSGMNFVREELACALRLAGSTAQDRLDVAAQLSGRLADTWALLDAGAISYVHTRILANAVERLDDRVTARVQARVLPRAPEQTPGEFRASVRRAVARFDRRDEATRHQQAFAERRVVHYPAEDGMADIYLRLAADGAAAFMAGVNALAGPDCATDPRTLDQRRADAAVELALAALHDPNLPKAHGQRPAVQVTVALSTLLGADDQPGELAGYGPIPASMARRIAADPTGTWRRLLVDQSGRLLDYGTNTYRPPADLTGHVLARDRHCAFPGCRRAAWHCELDHRIPHPTGATSADNLEVLCHRHHMLKHHGAWQITKHPDGTYEWTAPTRHRYRYRPPEYPVPTEVREPSTARIEPAADPPPF